MADTETAPSTAADLLKGAAEEDTAPNARTCAYRECDRPLPSDAHPVQKYHSKRCRKLERDARRADKSAGISGGKAGKLRKQLGGLFGMVGTTVWTFDQVCGTAILRESQNLADGLVAVADKHPQVRQVLENMVAVSAWGQVASPVMSIGLTVIAHHTDLIDTEDPQTPLDDFASNIMGNGEQSTDS